MFDIDKLLNRLEAAEKERIVLRAKIAEMERQEPAGYGVRYVALENGEEDWDSIWMHRVFAEDHTKDFTQAYVDIGEPVGAITVVPLYALPGAQRAPSVPDTYAAGINAVAAMLQSKADEYAKEHGHDDMGGLSFGPGMGGEIKMDYYTNLIELVDDVRAMLTAAPNVPSVPDGWKLVPIEPTTEIRKAMHYAYWQSPQLPYHDGSPELWNAAYAAMLEAAPEAKP